MIPPEVIRTLVSAERILVATHIYPDGDAIGSQLALGIILRKMGKKVFLYGEEKVSHLYDFLPDCDLLELALPGATRFDCAVSVDCGDQFRLGGAADQLLKVHPFIMIDHHAGHKTFGDLHWVDPKRASTGEMIFDLARAMGVEITYDAAYCLYTAIVSDTGSFKYSSTTADTFRVAAELIGIGVKPAEVAGKLFDNFTFNRLQLLKLVLDSMEIHGNQQIALIRATREMFAETDTVPADTENFINYPRSLSSVKVAAFIKENREGIVSVSLRSKGNDYDVAQLAASFGGGGHRNAAGFKMRGMDTADVREKVLASLQVLVGN